MRKFLLILLLLFFTFEQPANAWDFSAFADEYKINKEVRAVKKLLKSQVKYANKNDFEKFISTYDEKYVSGDGFNLDVYSTMVKDLWGLYDGIEYAVEFKDININGNEARVELVETSFADIDIASNYDGELKSISNSVYYLRKINGKWKVVSDSVIDEITSMLYGDAKDLEVKLTVPNSINAGTDYLATLEFEPPAETFAIASIALDKVEYPQKSTKEVFRLMPEDNILERYFTSNKENLNEYIVASIGLTKTTVTDVSFNLSLTGFGYTIKRVNVIPNKDNFSEEVRSDNVENK